MKLVSTIALVVCISLSGCASFSTILPDAHQTTAKQIPEANDANTTLKTTTPCCSRFGDITYKDLANFKEADEIINTNNQVYQFTDGKSYFSAYKLPANKGNLRITLSSLFTKTVFVPKVVLLDGTFNITREIDSSAFQFEPAKLLNDNQFTATFTIDRSHYDNIHNETYMIVYTPENKLKESTVIDSEEMRYARARALTPPRNATVNVPHSACGTLHLYIEYLAEQHDQDNIYIPETKETPSPDTAPTASMLKETEDYYNEQIKKAIQHNDIKKAVALYKEAKRLGSPTAESVLIKGLE